MNKKQEKELYCLILGCCSLIILMNIVRGTPSFGGLLGIITFGLVCFYCLSKSHFMDKVIR